MISLFKENNMVIPFSVTACARDIIRMQSLLTELKSIGLYKVFIGAESFVQRQLDFYNKNITVEENIKAIHIIKEVNLELSLGLIAFDPDVTLDEVEKNFIALKEMHLKNAGMAPFSLHTYLVAVRGTPFMNALVKDNKYIPNERGYEFKYKSVEKVVKYIDIWNKSTAPLIRKSYLIEVAHDESKLEKEKRLKKIYEQFIELDIDYVISLCRSAKGDNALNNIYSNYYQKYQKIYIKFKFLLQEE